MRAAPAVSRAKQVTKTHTSIQVQRRTSDIPCAMALRLITRSPRRRIRLVTVIGELTASPRPVGPTRLRQLDTSNGCRNHTTSPYAATSFVCALLIAHGSGSIQNPPCHHVSRLTLPRPPHPIPTFVTMANAPLGGRDAGNMKLIWGKRQENISEKQKNKTRHLNPQPLH